MSKTFNSWIQTASGKKFHLLEPATQEVSIQDIAESLSKLCRFSGHTQYFYSVAQHSCFVMSLLPIAAQPYGLLHDAHEAYTGDLTNPVRNLVTAKAGYDVWKDVTHNIEKTVHEAFGLAWPPHPTLAKLVIEADRIALATERRDVMADGPLWEVPLPAADKKVLRPWSWAESHHQFLECFQKVCKTRPEMMRAIKGE